MEMKILTGVKGYSVYVNDTHIGTWSYLDGAIEALRKEVLERIYEEMPISVEKDTK